MREESSLKSFLRFGVYCYNMLRGYYWQFMAKHFPAVNAKEEMKTSKTNGTYSRSRYKESYLF